MEKEEMIRAEEFCKSHHVEISFIQTLEQYGLLETVIMEETTYVSSNHLQSLEKAVHMYTDLGINMEGIEAINHLLERVEKMQYEIAVLKNRLSFYEDEGK